MAILAAPTTEPTVAVRHQPDLVSASRRPGLEFLLRCHRRADAWSLFLAQSILALLLTFASHAIFATSLASALVFEAALTLAGSAAAVSCRAIYGLWDSGTVRGWRKKVVFEFLVVALGPGNLLIVVALWPGWLLLGLVFWTLRCWTGW